MTRKSLQDAVLDVAVRNYTFPPKTFSAYDITKLLRADVNNKLYDITEFVGMPSRFGQEVSHSQVRDMVAALFDSRHFDRTFNGTFFEYSVGTIRSTAVATVSGIVTPDITVDPLYTRFLTILVDQSGIDAKSITPKSTLSGSLGFDDLDVVEVIMAFEDEFSAELKNKELPEPAKTLTDIESLFNYLKNAISKQSTGTNSTATPVAVVPTTTPKDAVLRRYIKARIDDGVNPSLKNAQKALKRPGTSVREVSDIAKSLGYTVLGNQTIPFSEWVISK